MRIEVFAIDWVELWGGNQRAVGPEDSFFDFRIHVERTNLFMQITSVD